MTQHDLLTVKDLGYSYGAADIFSGLSFGLAAGGILQVTGRNGSGKTTLLRLLAGTKTCESGIITWKDNTLRTLLSHKNGLKGELSPLENLSLYAAQAKTCADILARLGLERLHHKKPCYMLSAGQQRKTALARVLFSGARVWLLDEPFTALDDKTRSTVTNLLAQHAKSGGAAIVATHDRLDLDASLLRDLVMS